MDNIYLQLTREFNQGSVRAILSSGQAVVFYKIAIMSKDGDWIVSEHDEDLACIRAVLGKYGARYRAGAPLDARWLAGGWSSHFEFIYNKLRIRTDFVSRPPRITTAELEQLWSSARNADFPVVPLQHLIEIKKTDREKDYVVIGELARLLPDYVMQLLQSRSARDIMKIADCAPAALQQASLNRAALSRVPDGVDKLEEELDRERRRLMKVNEERLHRYMEKAQAWYEKWLSLQSRLQGLDLENAHQLLVSEAAGTLPFVV